MDAKQTRLLGLSKVEQKVLAALSLTPASIAELSRTARLARTTVNYAIRNLDKRGLLSISKKGKRKLWSLEGGTSSDGVTPFPVSAETSIEIRRGASAIYDLWWSMTSTPKFRRLYAVQPDKSFNLAVEHFVRERSSQALIELNERIRKNKVIVEAAVHETTAETIPRTLQSSGQEAVPFLKSFMGRMADTVKLPPEFMNYGTEIFFCDDVFAIIHWEDEVAVVIKNKEVVAFFKGMFESLKYLCARYDQSEKMAKKIIELETTSGS